MGGVLATRTCCDCGDVRTVQVARVADRTRILTTPVRCVACHCRYMSRLQPAPVPDDVDEVVVRRLVNGQRVRANTAERAEAARILTARKLSAAEIARRMGVSSRTVVRYRRRAA